MFDDSCYTKANVGVTKIIRLSTEHVWIEIPTSEEPLLVGCIYRSPSNDSDKEGCIRSATETSQLVKTAYDRNNNIIIAGDFNYKEIDWGNEYAPPNKEHQAIFINALQDCFLYQHVTEPTRFRLNETPNLLDLIMSSDESIIQNLDYLPPLGESDHICIRFNAMCGMKETVMEESAERNFFKTDFAAVIKELDKYNWITTLNSNFEEDYKRFFDILEDIMVRYTPLRAPKKKRKNLYMTREARRLKN